MSLEEQWIATTNPGGGAHNVRPLFGQSGFEPSSGIYNPTEQLGDDFRIPTEPDLSASNYVLSQFPHPETEVARSKVALIDSSTRDKLTYAQLYRSVHSLASGLYHGLGLRKGDVVFVLSPNSILYPTICLAIFTVGAILSPANPVNTEAEIAKQIRDSGAKLVISSPEELHKVVKTGVPAMTTTRKVNGDDELSVEELIKGGDEHFSGEVNVAQSDTAAILYSSGTTGTSKGVVLTHSNFIAITTLLKWSVYKTSSQDDVFLCFIPMFHIYGLAFFGLGLFTAGITTVVMPRYDLQAMLDAVEAHRVNNIPLVPPIVLGLVKHASKVKCDLSSLRRVGSGAAPLSKELSDAFRQRFPWVEIRQGYGLTESCGAATFFTSGEQAKAHPESCGRLIPNFRAKIVNFETGTALPPGREGELWIKSPAIMKGYLRNEEATAATLDPDGWLKTGDLGYFDQDGFLYIVDRIKELIKHNGYQVAPAELEALLLGHPQILDAAVIPVEDEEAGQIPMAYVVRAADSDLTESTVIQFVASQVAPYKKVRKVDFIDAIPKSAAGKILRKELVSLSRQKLLAKL